MSILFRRFQEPTRVRTTLASTSAISSSRKGLRNTALNPRSRYSDITGALA